MLLVEVYKNMSPKHITKQREILTAAHHDHKKGLCSRAFYKMNDRSISEDLVQDTFMKTWMYMAKGGKIVLMKAFLYHTLNNLIIDEYRKGKTTSLDVLMDAGLEPTQNPPSRSLDVTDWEMMTLLIKRLPEKYQGVIQMKCSQGLSLTEMSVITGQSKNALAVQVHRGLVKLKALSNTSTKQHLEQKT